MAAKMGMKFRIQMIWNEDQEEGMKGNLRA